jgi:hypothetical protein
MPEIPPEFEKALILLHQAEINFVLIGGLALILHGGRLYTEDFDISVAVDEENMNKVCDWLMTHHARPSLFNPNLKFDITPNILKKHRFLNLKTDLGDVDVFLSTPTGIESFEGLWERGETINFGKFTVRVASIDDLIVMKKAVNRTKDQLHLMELQALKKLIEEDK